MEMDDYSDSMDLKNKFHLADLIKCCQDGDMRAMEQIHGLERHLKECETCRNFFAEMKALVVEAKQLEIVQPAENHGFP